MCAGVRKSFLFSAFFLALVWLSLSIPGPAWSDKSNETENELPSWSAELESLREILLTQIDYAKSLKAELATRKISQDDYEKALQRLKESLLVSDQKISDLETRLGNSIELEESLRKELNESKRLLVELKKQHEEASMSLKAYKDEAEGQIREARQERDREATKKGIWQIISVVLAVLATIAAVL